MLDELQNRLAFLEKRLTVLEHEVSGLKAGRRDETRRASVMLPHRVPCDATGLLIANGYDLDPNDSRGKWRWVGNDGPIQFVLPFGLGENATARILLAGHPKVDLQFLRVYVNDKPVEHSLVGDGAERLALLVPLEPSPQTVNIVLDQIKSISLKEIREGEDTRPLAFKFFGMEIVARQAIRDEPRSSTSFAPEPELADPSIRFGDMRLDERFAGTGDYRHLDISVFDTSLGARHWDRIKFKFANFKGDSYLEFRSRPNSPEIFRVWPGRDEDANGKLFKIPEPKASEVPKLADRGDLAMLEALFENLDLIVRTVTQGIDAPRQEIELWRVEARALADRALALLAAAPGEALSPALPEPKPEPEVVDDAIRFERVRLDERLPQSGEYRHLDISIFDVPLKSDHWQRIKFKFASFQGDNYLEFRSRPEVFRVWPGTEEDAFGKLVKIPQPKTAVVPEFADPRDREVTRALFENLDAIVGAATAGIDAPDEEVALWRAEARALANRMLPLLKAEPEPEPEVGDDPIQFGKMRLDEYLPGVGEYRHLDISIFDARLKNAHWERIKFKFASFRGRNYLEFRDIADRPEVFRIWPGTEEDAISKLVNIPDPKTAAVPEIRDVGDLDILRALFETLDLIVRTVTTGIDAPAEEIELWRAEARALADVTLRALATE